MESLRLEIQHDIKMMKTDIEEVNPKSNGGGGGSTPREVFG